VSSSDSAALVPLLLFPPRFVRPDPDRFLVPCEGLVDAGEQFSVPGAQLTECVYVCACACMHVCILVSDILNLSVPSAQLLNLCACVYGCMNVCM
jgi:hypothetical protein